MIPFRELQNLCDELRNKTGACCSIEAEYFSYDTGASSLRYKLYVANLYHRYFDTVRELKTAIRNILNPQEDVGVALSERKEQVDESSE